jgi:hypothetical protein
MFSIPKLYVSSANTIPGQEAELLLRCYVGCHALGFDAIATVFFSLGFKFLHVIKPRSYAFDDFV